MRLVNLAVASLREESPGSFCERILAALPEYQRRPLVQYRESVVGLQSAGEIGRRLIAQLREAAPPALEFGIRIAAPDHESTYLDVAGVAFSEQKVVRVDGTLEATLIEGPQGTNQALKRWAAGKLDGLSFEGAPVSSTQMFAAWVIASLGEVALRAARDIRTAVEVPIAWRVGAGFSKEAFLSWLPGEPVQVFSSPWK